MLFLSPLVAVTFVPALRSSDYLLSALRKEGNDLRDTRR